MPKHRLDKVYKGKVVVDPQFIIDGNFQPVAAGVYLVLKRLGRDDDAEEMLTRVEALTHKHFDEAMDIMSEYVYLVGWVSKVYFHRDYF